MTTERRGPTVVETLSDIAKRWNLRNEVAAQVANTLSRTIGRSESEAASRFRRECRVATTRGSLRE